MADALLGNWIADTNRFKLPAPPGWFLKRLFDHDALLVIIPSRIKVEGEPPGYLLCRRRVTSAGLGDVAMLDNKHPDTNMCYVHGVVPIAPLRFNNGARTFTAAACDSLIRDLKARDTWAISGGPQGDADKVWQAVEDAEAAQAALDKANMRDMFYHMARDAWRSLKARTGQRNKTPFDGNRFAKVGGAPREQRRIIVS